MPCHFDYENALRTSGATRIAGIDEAGRGPLAGPVVVAGVILPPTFCHSTLNDSKQVPARFREGIYEELTRHSEIRWSISIVEPLEIDRINILRATHLGMRRVAEILQPDHVLIDGLPVAPFPWPQTALVKGDSISLSIAAASILAKVTRDRLMLGWHEKYPAYDFARHKGYPTRLHLAKLREYGPCEIHRRSFAPVAECWFDFS